MKVSTKSGLWALGLAGRALADGYEVQDGPASAFAGDANWAPQAGGAATTTITKTVYTETVTAYSSTVYVHPDSCATATVTVDGAGKAWPAPAAATATWTLTSVAGAATASGDGWGSGPATVTVTETASSATTEYRSTLFVGPGYCATATVTVDPASVPFPPTGAPVAPTGGNGAGWASGGSDGSEGSGAHGNGWANDPSHDNGWVNDVSTIGTNDAVFTWTGDVPTATSLIPAPVYTGWPSDGSTPDAGSSGSNVTAHQEGVSGNSCNTAADRSKWCGGKTTSSDYYAADYSTGQTCSYDFTITNTTIDFDGSGPKISFAINGQVPGPLVECNWGDVLQVTVHNKLANNATTIHWHGITQKGTNDQDGVPGITECAIAPGSSRTYTMKLNQYGTGWYHSHVLAQYGDGIRGPMIVHGPATANYDLDMGTVMIDDTFEGTAAQQNARIAHTGPTGTVNYLLNGKNTKPDLSAGQHALWSVQSGKKHLFRFINSAAQNMFSVHFDQHVMTVIAADYVPIVPYQTEWLNIGIGQRYDVIVEMNQPVAGYFLRAVAQTGCPSGSANNGLGNANGIILYQGAKETLPTSTFGKKTPADFAICADEPIASLVPFLKKAAGTAGQFAATVSTLPAGNVAQVSTSDDGSVFRWFINNGAINVNFTQPTLQTLGQGGSGRNGTNGTSLISNSITLGTANQWVYFVIQNQFFASHPMHLHGHDFSLLGQGTVAWTPALVPTLNFANPTRRDTAMLAGSRGPGNPPGYTVIGFETDNPGAWLMHCHIIWHVDGGLALQFTERPSEISAYASKPDFQSECASEVAYEAANPGRVHGSGSSGLRRRTYFDELMAARAKDVVRRDSPAKQHLEANRKRALGDGYKPRHMRH